MKDAAERLRKAVSQNSSARDTIRSVHKDANGIHFVFKERNDANWCVNEVLMLARQAGIKVRKGKIFPGTTPNSLTVTN